MAEIPSVAPSQLAATCLFGLEQEIHFSTIYTADLRNKLITAAKLHSHSVRVTSVTPGRGHCRRCQMARRSGGSCPVDTPALLPKSSREKELRPQSPLLDIHLQPRRGLPAFSLGLELIASPARFLDRPNGGIVMLSSRDCHLE